MRTLPALMASRIAEGDFTGPARPTTRVTIQKVNMAVSGTGARTFASLIFQSGKDPARELPNVRKVHWERSADSDTGACSMELFNTEPLAPGALPQVGDGFDLLGYYTYNRGKSAYAQNTWGQQANQWQDFIVPDRVIRVYQGYGVDWTKSPENDPNLLLMGVFIIDDVTYTADGIITVDCRDTGRLLSDQIMFPPVVPLANYPLAFETVRDVKNDDKVITATWRHPVLDDSSSSIGGVPLQFGHHPSHAFDASTTTYHLSMGHDVPNHPSSYEWLQAKVSSATLQGVRVSVRGGPYRVYLSVYEDKAAGAVRTGWRGSVKVPYKVSPTGTGRAKTNIKADIPYSMTMVAKANATTDFAFPQRIKGVTKIRLTFTSLYNTKQMPGPYRVAVRDVLVTDQLTHSVPNGTHKAGNYTDYSDIVKLLLAYGGFYWPQDARQLLTDTVQTYHFPAADPVLATGRVWADVMQAGTAGRADSPLGVEIWDKKPLIDGINYVKDVLGYIFFIDETGAAIFRPPNIFQQGNYRVDRFGINAVHSTDYVTVEDSQMILGLRAKLSSRNLREHVFVANVDGKKGRVAAGRIPHPSGFRRVGGWTDQNFEDDNECQVMADMITLRQYFTYRQDSVRIAANPAIQVDDQVRIVERTTAEAYLHYVRAVSSDWDAETGAWTYDLTTSWLGESPEGDWAFTTEGMDQVTKDYLAALGQIPPESHVIGGTVTVGKPSNPGADVGVSPPPYTPPWTGVPGGGVTA